MGKTSFGKFASTTKMLLSSVSAQVPHKYRITGIDSYFSNFPDPENDLKPCPALLAPSVLPLKYSSTCHRHSGKGLFDVSGHVFNELADKCLNLLVCYILKLVL